MLLGGLFSFDLAEQFEPLPAPAEPARHCPDYLFLVPELLLDIDHLARRTSLQAFVHDPAGHDRLAASLRQCADEFHGAVEEASESPVAGVRAGNYQVDLDDASFARQVERLQAHVRAGDVFQIVPSRSFSMPCADSGGPIASCACATPARTASSSMRGTSACSALRRSRH